MIRKKHKWKQFLLKGLIEILFVTPWITTSLTKLLFSILLYAIQFQLDDPHLYIIQSDDCSSNQPKFVQYITENFHQEYNIHSLEILSSSRNNTHYIKIHTHLIAIDAVVIHRAHTALISTSFSRNAIYYPRYIHEKQINQPASKLVCTHRVILVYGISKRLATAANDVQTCFVRPLHSYTFRNVLSFNNTRFKRNRTISVWLDRIPGFEFFAKMRFVLKLYVLMMDSF